MIKPLTHYESIVHPFIIVGYANIFGSLAKSPICSNPGAAMISGGPDSNNSFVRGIWGKSGDFPRGIPWFKPWFKPWTNRDFIGFPSAFHGNSMDFFSQNFIGDILQQSAPWRSGTFLAAIVRWDFFSHVEDYCFHRQVRLWDIA